jgi:glucose dehydrogenase
VLAATVRRVARLGLPITPHDNWDYDATSTMVLVDLRSGQRKTLVVFNKNGFQYTLDRTIGEVLAATLCGRHWAERDLKTGRPVLVHQADRRFQGLVRAARVSKAE